MEKQYCPFCGECNTIGDGMNPYRICAQKHVWAGREDASRDAIPLGLAAHEAAALRSKRRPEEVVSAVSKPEPIAPPPLLSPSKDTEQQQPPAPESLAARLHAIADADVARKERLHARDMDDLRERLRLGLKTRLFAAAEQGTYSVTFDKTETLRELLDAMDYEAPACTDAEKTMLYEELKAFAESQEIRVIWKEYRGHTEYCGHLWDKVGCTKFVELRF